MEFIVKDKADFDVLKSYASYYSPITGVLEISDNFMPELFTKHESVISKYVNRTIHAVEDKKPIVSLGGSEDRPKLYVDEADDGTKLYLDLPYNGEIRADSFAKLLDLLRLGLVRANDEVRGVLSKDLTVDSPIASLFSKNFSTNYKHKRWTLMNAGTTIRDLDFFNKDTREIVFTKLTVYSNLRVKSVTADNKVMCETDDGRNYELRFFYLSEGKKSILSAGTRISVMSDKIYGGGNNKILIDPEIVPLNFPNSFVRNEIKTSKRDIPVKLLRIAWAEYAYRMKS